MALGIWILCAIIVGISVRSCMVIKNIGDNEDKIMVPTIASVFGPFSLVVGLILLVIIKGSEWIIKEFKK